MVTLACTTTAVPPRVRTVPLLSALSTARPIPS